MTAISRRRITVLLLQISIVILWIAVWEYIVDAKLVDPLFVASPSAIFNQAGDWLSLVLLNAAPTLFAIAIAFILGSTLGIVLGLLVGSRKLVRDSFDPFLSIANSFPKITLFPIILLIFGLGVSSNAFYGFIACLLPVMFGISGAVAGMDRSYIYIAKSYNPSATQLYTKVIIPSLYPAILANLRIGFLQAVIAVLLGEMFLAQNGLGALISNLSYKFQTAQLYGVTIFIALATLLVNALLLVWEKRTQRFRKI